jgi:hypothetical protein
MRKKRLLKSEINKNNKKKLSKKIKEKPKLNITVYVILRFLVILCMVAQSLHGNWNNVFLCILTLILFTVPTFISKTFNITLPTTLEVIVYLFIFASEILGEIQNFYGIFVHWDSMLHTLNGFLCAAVGFSLIDILNNNDDLHISMTPAFVALVAFCFSMTIGVLWEFGEFAADRYFNKDMQKDRIVSKISSVKINPEGKNEPILINNIDKTIIYSNNNQNVTVIEGGYLELGIIDTMKDLFVNFIGAIVFSVLGYLYIKNRDSYKFAERFIVKKNKQVT